MRVFRILSAFSADFFSKDIKKTALHMEMQFFLRLKFYRQHLI